MKQDNGLSSTEKITLVTAARRYLRPSAPLLCTTVNILAEYRAREHPVDSVRIRINNKEVETTAVTKKITPATTIATALPHPFLLGEEV